MTIVVGAVGAIAYSDVNKILIYNIIIAVGVIVYGVTLTTNAGFEGAIYYLIHDMIIKAALFLLAGSIVRITGTTKLKKMGGLIKDYPLLGWMFFIATISLAEFLPKRLYWKIPFSSGRLRIRELHVCRSFTSFKPACFIFCH